MHGRMTHCCGVVYVLKPGDHQAGVDGDSFKLTNHGHATFLIPFATLTGDGVLTVYSGATAGTKTTALTFAYRLSKADQGAAADADVYAQADGTAGEATSAALTLTAATYSDRVLVVEVRGRQLTDGHDWLTLEFSAAATALNAAVIAVLSDARYMQRDQPTATA